MLATFWTPKNLNIEYNNHRIELINEEIHPMTKERYSGIEIFSYVLYNADNDLMYQSKEEAMEGYLQETTTLVDEILDVVPLYGDEDHFSIDYKSGQFIGFARNLHHSIAPQLVFDFITDLNRWLNDGLFVVTIYDLCGRELLTMDKSEFYDDAIRKSKKIIDSLIIK